MKKKLNHQLCGRMGEGVNMTARLDKAMVNWRDLSLAAHGA
jgi:hypothetical protein